MHHNNKLHLFSPPSARTEDSIALIWDRPESPDIFCYRVLINDTLHAVITCTDYTVELLDPAMEYSFQVQAVDADGNVIADSQAIRAYTKPQSKRLNITDYGAVADGRTNNTKAIQLVIDACPPGGTVYIPEGIFLTGALNLKSDMTLYVEHLGRLKGSVDTVDYPLLRYLWEGQEHLCYASLLNTAQEGRLHDITIAGSGVIDASGMELFQAEMAEQKGKRGRSICLRDADGVYLKDIIVRSSPSWCIHPIRCTDVCMNNIRVYTKRDEYGRTYENVFNGDGIDPESCRDVAIFHSTIASQDDCIAIKSGRDKEGRDIGSPSRNIRITNCAFKSGFGVAMGSEMSGGVENVLVQDCTFEEVYSVGTIKAPRPRGGYIRNITFDHCTLVNRSFEHTDCKWFRGAINIDQFYGGDEVNTESPSPIDKGTPIIENIVFRNILLDTCAGNAIFIAGLPESPLRNIRLENVTAIGKYGMKAYHVNGLSMESTNVSARQGEAVELQNTTKTK